MPTTPAAGSSTNTTMKTAGIGLAVGLVLGLGLTLKVYMSGQDALTEQVAQTEQAQATAQKLASRVALLEVHLDLRRALDAFDAQNFGLANDKLAAAGVLLGKVDVATSGADASAVSALSERLGRAKVDVGLDMVAQRADLASLLASADTLLGG